MDSLGDFPSDIYFEILTRTPLETLETCRLVSMQWNGMTYHSSFLKSLHQRTKTLSGFFINNDKFSTTVSPNIPAESSDLSLGFIPNRTRSRLKIEAVANQGLVLVQKEVYGMKNYSQFYVCKPSTKEWHQIPNPKTKYFTQKISMVVLGSKPLQYYKIVRLSEPKHRVIKHEGEWYCVLHCEIFDSTSWVWKRLEDVRFPFCSGLVYNPVVLACGTRFHWLRSDNQVFVFDVEKEDWTVFGLPNLACLENNKKLVQYEGRVGLVYKESESQCMELWVVEEYYYPFKKKSKQVSWNKKQRIVLSDEALNKFHPTFLPCAFYSSDVVVIQSFYDIVFYNFVSDQMVKIKIPGDWCSRDVVHYQTDFEANLELFKATARICGSDDQLNDNLLSEAGDGRQCRRTRSIAPVFWWRNPTFLFLIIVMFVFTLLCHVCL
ncbi:F-box protein [Quillaja saponaria]|uniref:F-box protein n=1 Tax=Quillaja saponaria TaxID=32244 RepID=A0AAD7LD76_QUISA|nr:F-box protein [Quillaja saponaria]